MTYDADREHWHRVRIDLGADAYMDTYIDDDASPETRAALIALGHAAVARMRHGHDRSLLESRRSATIRRR